MSGSETCIPLPASVFLSKEEISRYGRQLILPDWGPQAQYQLKSGRVIIIGCGGLGCPAAIYLAAAGIGILGLVDYDTVDRSNLHRQVMHSEDTLNKPKCASLAQRCATINPEIYVQAYQLQLHSGNAMDVLKNYDVVLDCTDNVATRYLLNDACVLLNKPLVSGSALRMEGQLTVYHHDNGPCYRCLYPSPPPPETVTGCSEAGVLGPIPGIIGTLQATETLLIVSGQKPAYSQKLVLYDGHSGEMRLIKLRNRQPECCVCGASPIVTKLIDYVQFCGAFPHDKVTTLSTLSDNRRISARQLFCEQSSSYLLLDVRPEVEFNICRLPNSVNLPMCKLLNEDAKKLIEKEICDSVKDIFVVCRRGNDSQTAVGMLQEWFRDISVNIRDVRGGLEAWTRDVQPEFPLY